MSRYDPDFLRSRMKSALLSLVRESPISTSDAAKALNSSYDSVLRAFQSLQLKGLVLGSRGLWFSSDERGQSLATARSNEQSPIERTKSENAAGTSADAAASSSGAA